MKKARRMKEGGKMKEEICNESKNLYRCFFNVSHILPRHAIFNTKIYILRI